MQIRITLLGLLLCGAVHAQPQAETATLDETEGSVVITPSTSSMIEEYRVNGRLFMIKVNPKKGPPYFLIDSDGDGVMDSRQDDLNPNMPVPSWVLLRW